MRLNKIITALLIAGMAGAALAQPVSVTGRVETVFVREARGLYYEKKLLTGAANKPVWAEVRTEAALPGEPQTELVRVPANLAVERGDIVAIRTGDDTALAMNLLPEVSRVTALVASHDTLAAMTYGIVNPAPVQNQLAHALSPWIPAPAANMRSSYR